ncbi:hypothetical protein GCM10020331_005370 [Ectobacillus funiculus]
MAYDQLVAEGYVRGEGRKGYFANELEPLLSQESLIPHNENQRESVTPTLIDFRAGAVDQTHFPLKNLEENCQSSINVTGELSIWETLW